MRCSLLRLSEAHAGFQNGFSGKGNPSLTYMVSNVSASVCLAPLGTAWARLKKEKRSIRWFTALATSRLGRQQVFTETPLIGRRLLCCLCLYFEYK